MDRITRRPPQAQPPRTRTLAARPARLAAAGLTVVTLTAALVLVWAASAQASVWIIPATARAFPGAKPGPAHTIKLDAAGGEYQGVQVCTRGGQRKVSLRWADGSDPLITANAQLFRVYYVHITTPTSHLGSRPGWYPDPLVPRVFGQSMTVPGSAGPGPTTPFYVLVHVPYGTPGGDYAATLLVDDGGTEVAVPFSLHVWDFGWRKISTHTAFAVSEANLKSSLPRSFTYAGENKATVLRNFYALMQQHGLSPTVVHYLPRVSASGDVQRSGNWVDQVSPYLDEGGDDVGLNDNQLPFLRWFPWSRSKSPSSGSLLNYFTQITRIYKDRGWDTKAYMYILDETTTRREERKAEHYAQLLHKADRATGAKVKFFLTDDPRPHSISSVKPANTFLYDDVDIWVPRYYYFFGRIPALRERQKAGKSVWWYTYVNASVGRMPNYVIDKPHIDCRVWGWMMERWHVDGLLNWGYDRWGKPTTGAGWRDPYRNPLSVVRGSLRANGDTCLVYPGYYPRYGLHDPLRGAVPSLRLEALRDGLEEREYLKIAKTYPGGTALVNECLGKITQFPYKIVQANAFNFPKYTHSNAVFDAQREKVAGFIESKLTP